MGRAGMTATIAESGYSLMGVMIFVFVIILSGLSFFALSASETRGAIYRQETTEAYYLAEAAVERARAKFIDDRAWRDGWTNVACGNGLYSLTVVDTTFGSLTNCVYLLATGSVGKASRQIEVFAEVPPAALSYAVNVTGDVDCNGNICVLGNLHVSGDPDFGNHDVHLHCGDLTDGFDIAPPVIHTEPAYYPDATYYYVRGTKVGSDYQARIFDALGNDITTALGDSLTGVTSYNNGQKVFTFDFSGDATINHYFDQVAGVFSRAAGDHAVVVNFGESPVINPPGINGVSDVIIDGTHASVNSTIINTRFTGVTSADRREATFWDGGVTTLKQLTMEPDYGIAVIVKDFMNNGGARVDLGTVVQPAFVYITGDIDGLNSNFELVGAVTLLGDWDSNGHLTIYYDTGFLADLPDYLFSSWDDGVTGALRILSWREV